MRSDTGGGLFTMECVIVSVPVVTNYGLCLRSTRRGADSCLDLWVDKLCGGLAQELFQIVHLWLRELVGFSCADYLWER